MENLFSYLKWRGDLTFEEADFNEVDNLILCAFTYLKIEEFMQKDKIISLKDLYVLYKDIINTDTIFERNRNLLFTYLYESKRFQNILIAKYVNEVDKDKEKQFCAMTFLLSDSLLFVAYKGTDETVTGWKEDFNMSYMKTIPAQERAKEYLEEVLKQTKKRVYVGGHSKGGNLAMYAFLCCSFPLKEKVLKVYNNDGPGFSDLDFEEKDTMDKIVTFIPRASIVGHLFENTTKKVIVESRQIGILQHDLYSWCVLENHLVYVSKGSERIEKIAHFLNQLLKDMLPLHKKRIVDILYHFFLYNSIENIEDFSNSLFWQSLSIEDFFLLKKLIPFLLNLLKSF